MTGMDCGPPRPPRLTLPADQARDLSRVLAGMGFAVSGPDQLAAD